MDDGRITMAIYKIDANDFGGYKDIYKGSFLRVKIIRKMTGVYVRDAIGTVTFKWLRSKRYYVKRVNGHSCGCLSGVLQTKFVWRGVTGQVRPTCTSRSGWIVLDGMGQKTKVKNTQLWLQSMAWLRWVDNLYPVHS